jgi:SNF2 family DNA or RNA helicase
MSTQKTVNLIGDTLHIRFPYDPAVVAQVKSLPSRRWNPDRKEWTSPMDPDTLQKLAAWRFTFSPEITAWLKAQATPATTHEIDFSQLSERLMPFQRKGIEFIEQRRGRALIGDQMGLGKTAQALSWLQLHPERRPAVIVCPASLKLNWKREIGLWMSGQPRIGILYGKNGKSLPDADIYIINYDILAGWLPELTKASPQVIICDEAHAIKNRTAQRTKAVKELCKGVPHVLMLTGTPIVNRPAEAFNMLNVLAPAHFPSFFSYGKEFCGAFQSRWGWDFSGATNLDKLHAKLQPIMIRRLKADVLQDLPDKRRAIVPMEIVNRKDYQRAESDFIGWLREKGGRVKAEAAARAEALASIEGLKQLTIDGKMDPVLEWVEDFLEAGEKLILFATHRKTIDAIMDKFGDKAVKVDGSVSAEDRQAAVDRFQADDSIRLFVGNIQAAGVGLTLTAASNVAFLELGWSPGLHDQAEDRAHRIGQKDSVTVWYLIAQDTIEERICRLLDSKRKVLNRVLDGKTGEGAEGVFESLLEEMQ